MITVFGSINIDFIGEVKRLPSPGETVAGSRLVIAPGGKGANQALAAARDGGSVRMVGAVGRDRYAGSALKLLRDGGVDLRDVAAVDEPTGTALIMVDEGGENIIAVLPGANERASTDQLKITASDTLLMQLEVPLAEVERAARVAKQAGARVILNAAPMQPVDTFIDAVDVLVVNEGEALMLADEERDPVSAARSLANDGRTVIVTLGARGAVALRGDRSFEAPALEVEPVDAVGAGDTFCGVLASGLSRGVGLEEATRRAVVAGSLATLKAGAQPAMPTKARIDATFSRRSRPGAANPR